VKHKSRAAKLRRYKRRGRPLTPNVAREPNGRISRAKVPPEPANRLALEVRARRMGVSVSEARDPRLATYIGRLYRLGAEHGGISRDQYAAALAFLEIRNNYQRAILSQGATWDECTQRTFGESEEETTRRNIARYEAMMKALREAQFDVPHENLYAPLQYLVIDDLELPYMIGTLRVALNLLCHHFFIDKNMSEMN